MTATEITTTADAQLAVVDVITDTLVWVFVDDDDSLAGEERDARVADLQNLADLIVSDLDLTVTAVGADGRLTVEIVLPGPAEDDPAE